MEIGHFGVEGIMLIQWERIQKRFENILTISEKKIGWQIK